MIAFETEATKIFVGRFERGEKLVERLEDFCANKGIEAGWIQGIGAVEWIELCHYDTASKEYREPIRLEGAFEITSLIGNVSKKEGEVFVHLHINISRETDKGIEVLGGHVIEAGVFACEFNLELFNGLELDRQLDEQTGLHLWADEKKIPPKTSGFFSAPRETAKTLNDETAESKSLSWIQAAELSIQQEKEEFVPPKIPAHRNQKVESFKPSKDGLTFESNSRRESKNEVRWEDVLQPRRGDWVSHKKFGLSRVVGKDKKGSLVIMTPEGRRKAIRLEVFKVVAPELRGEKQVFVLVPNKS